MVSPLFCFHFMLNHISDYLRNCSPCYFRFFFNPLSHFIIQSHSNWIVFMVCCWSTSRHLNLLYVGRNRKVRLLVELIWCSGGACQDPGPGIQQRSAMSPCSSAFLMPHYRSIRQTAVCSIHHILFIVHYV